MTREIFKIGLCAMFLGGACATTGTLTKQDVFAHYSAVAQLDEQVMDVKERNAELLAPHSFARAQELLDRSMDAAQSADKVRAQQLAAEGLAEIEQVERHMAVSRQALEEVLSTRQRALYEGADALMSDEVLDADERLREATRIIEKGDVAKARNQGPALMQRYADLELRAVKAGTSEAAGKAVEQAERADADDYAPRTLQAARAELDLVRAVLESDRTQREKADAHARQAIWLSGRALALTELAKTFEAQDYDLEDILLWHQAQLEEISQPLDVDLPFDESNRAAVSTLRDGLRSMLDALGSARATNQDHQTRIAQLQIELEQAHSDYQDKLAKLAKEQQEQLAQLQNATASQLRSLQSETKDKLEAAKKEYEEQLSVEARARAEAERHRQQAEQRYQQVQSLFDEGEALVSRHGQDVWIDVYGFDFKPGASDIGSKNFGLLQRLLSALNEFPQSRVRIEGHTDSRGSEDRNLRLSIERAAAVKQFLTDVGRVDGSRVESEGYGESKPVAPNETSAGRAKNRRISVRILNEVEAQTPPSQPQDTVETRSVVPSS